MSEFCDCPQDGYCERYGREMTGRHRQICQGIDCDLGTAAAFREQWRRERPAPTLDEVKQRTCLLLKTDQAVGDAVAMTAAIYSLHTAHPGKYLTAVESRWPEVFQYNPDVHYHVTPDSAEEPFHFSQPHGVVQMHYPAIHDSNERGIHFMQGYCEFLEAALGVRVPLLTNRPHLYFAPGLPEPPTTENYWVVCSGGKSDFTNKLWGFGNYDEVVTKLCPDIKFIQVGEKTSDHPQLSGRNVRYEVGKTSLRSLFMWVRHARGVLCGVSLLMHVAAALGKPAIVIAGGREPVAWNAYPNQQYLHTVGMLPCTDPQGRAGACWRSRVVPVGDNPVLDKDPCQRPLIGLRTTPECMTLIPPERVANLIHDTNRQYERAQR